MLNEKQLDCIDLLMSGNITVTDVAKQVGVDRKTLSKWKNHDEEFKAELDRRRQNYENDIVKTANTLLKAHLGKSIDNIIKIANNSKVDVETRLKANRYIVDKIIADAKPVQETNEIKEPVKVNNINEIAARIKEKQKYKNA